MHPQQTLAAPERLCQHVQALESLIAKACGTLDAGLQVFWPAVNHMRNGLSEAHLTLQLAHAAQSAGWCAYPEVGSQSFEAGHTRIDLMLLKPEESGSSSCLALVECKKLYSVEKAEEMLQDLQKMQRLEFRSGFRDRAQWAEAPSYAIWLAFGFSESWRTWWCAPYLYDNGGAWDRMHHVLTKDALLFGAHSLQAHHPASRAHHHVLYAIFPVSSVEDDRAVKPPAR